MSNCFKGEFKITTQSLLGKADVKRLRSQLMDEFPNLTKRMLDKVLLKDVDLNLLKCSNGTQLYVPGDGPAAFFDDGFGGIFPTLFTLWKLPQIMPELVTHGPVSKFLLPKERSAGADMMLPGVIVPDEGLGSFAVGQKRCIRVDGNPQPFAVGKMLVSDEGIKKTGMKGKGMAVLHVYRDSLWSYAGRKIPNDGFGADEITASDGKAEEPEAEAEAEEEEEEEEEEARGPGSERASRKSGEVDPVDEMAPDALMEYCFYAAFKTTCTDAVIGKGITADTFYSHHMQPARPSGQPQLDAKKTSFKQIGKFIKHMHKAKAIAVREVKNVITILSVDRNAPAYGAFELQGSAKAKDGGDGTGEGDGAAGSAPKAGAGSVVGKAKEEEVVALRTRPPVVKDIWQPNSYTKPLFEAVGFRDKNATYTLQEMHKALDKYIETRLVKAETSDYAGTAPVDVSDATGSAGADSTPPVVEEVAGVLRRIGMAADSAESAAASLAGDGLDSVPALKAASMEAWEFAGYGLSDGEAEGLVKMLANGGASGAVQAWLEQQGMPSDAAATCAAALAADGYDSLDALKAGKLAAATLLAKYHAPADSASALATAMGKLSLASTGSAGKSADGGGGGGEGLGLGPDFDKERVPLDELLLNSLVKLAGGAKKGATFATHMPLKQLQESMKERMTAFHRVEVEGEAPFQRKGGLKLICIEMKRAAGHNKTHVSGLESFCISPNAVADALKVKLGCTTAVLKLPGNNVKDMEVLLQGHCVDEVLAYLRDVYCIDKQWIELKLKESKKSNM